MSNKHFYLTGQMAKMVRCLQWRRQKKTFGGEWRHI